MKWDLMTLLLMLQPSAQRERVLMQTKLRNTPKATDEKSDLALIQTLFFKSVEWGDQDEQNRRFDLMIIYAEVD